MADFLLFLGKTNLAIGAAIILVLLLRRPLRTQFGAPIAYALWLLVPIAGFAILLPPRTEASRPAYVMPLHNPVAQNPDGQYPAAQMPVVQNPAARNPIRKPAPMPVMLPTPRSPAQLTDRIASLQSMVEAETADAVSLDYVLLLFAAWALGIVLMALYLARLQARFHATMRLGEAGPAVLGFFRPRVVMPDNFQDQYTAPEQAAILAHERVHLARQDARINALAALLRCLCWFNPLVHLGAASMRIDQELACDATALAGAVSRRDYARALLKSQMMVTLLPLGCNWPGSQHPLIERIALLKRKRPGTARRIAGAGLVMVVATCAGLGAWAAQPPVPAKSISAPRLDNQIALVMPPTTTPANPVSGGDSAKNHQVTQPVSVVTPPEMTKVGSAETQSALPALQDSLPEQNIALALNEATGAAVAKAATDMVSGAQSNRAAAEKAAAGLVQVATATPAGTASNSVSQPWALINGKCQPIKGGPGGANLVIGTVLNVHDDPARTGTDIVLDQIAPTPGVSAQMRDGTIVAVSNAGGLKAVMPAYVGKKVIMWEGPYPRRPGVFMVINLELLCDPSQIQRDSASETSPAAAVTRNDPPVAPMRPAMPDPSAGAVQVAAATPASANPDPASAMELLSSKPPPVCSPMIGTVVSVHSDPQVFGTDIVLESGQLPKNPLAGFGTGTALQLHYSQEKKQDVFIAVVPIGFVKNLPALNSYVGQQVAIWPGVGRDGNRPFFQITSPRQLQLLYTALADPKKTWCFLSNIQRSYP